MRCVGLGCCCRSLPPPKGAPSPLLTIQRSVRLLGLLHHALGLGVLANHRVGRHSGWAGWMGWVSDAAERGGKAWRAERPGNGSARPLRQPRCTLRAGALRRCRSPRLPPRRQSLSIPPRRQSLSSPRRCPRPHDLPRTMASTSPPGAADGPAEARWEPPEFMHERLERGCRLLVEDERFMGSTDLQVAALGGLGAAAAAARRLPATGSFLTQRPLLPLPLQRFVDTVESKVACYSLLLPGGGGRPTELEEQKVRVQQRACRSLAVLPMCAAPPAPPRSLAPRSPPALARRRWWPTCTPPTQVCRAFSSTESASTSNGSPAR